ncbi:hypothetical protein BFF78_22010 [Streptomyces fodineus]|uniref:Uncharacterized protein n=1 Tax=Streptomyces fodineus TaxID=1904616 RepID=A0A1D7YD33_9ACTN|nr:hypothetical protein [Streptomyces fodineus]AOR33390.1 hypothetical protein BFF78_22010 [Streptomyces fodineus]
MSDRRTAAESAPALPGESLLRSGGARLGQEITRSLFGTARRGGGPPRRYRFGGQCSSGRRRGSSFRSGFCSGLDAVVRRASARTRARRTA